MMVIMWLILGAFICFVGSLFIKRWDIWPAFTFLMLIIGLSLFGFSNGEGGGSRKSCRVCVCCTKCDCCTNCDEFKSCAGY